jgi:hypothetical protein
MKRYLRAAASLIVLLLAVFLLANAWVGSGSTAALVQVARSKCVEDGLPAQEMRINEVTSDSGLFGFGGHGTVEFGADGTFGPDGKRRMEPLVIRVELRRRMNLLEWEVARVSHDP